MQIPYDLEFVENRPRVDVSARAVALPGPYAAWGGEKRRTQDDAFDVLLRWLHRKISQFEKR